MTGVTEMGYHFQIGDRSLMSWVHAIPSMIFCMDVNISHDTVLNFFKPLFLGGNGYKIWSSPCTVNLKIENDLLIVQSIKPKVLI